MAGRLGSDFNAADPADDSSVKYGASWIRDIKTRLISFVAVLFNRETGDFKDNVIRTESLRDLSPSPAGTWRQVVVGPKGLVLSGTNPVSQPVAGIYRAVFVDEGANGRVKYDTVSGVVDSPLAGPSTSYGGSGIYIGTYDAGSEYWSFTFVVPDGVRRVKFQMSGGGGGAHITTLSEPVHSANSRTSVQTTNFDIDKEGGANASSVLPDGTKIRNTRTGEQILIVSYSAGDFVVERAQDGTTAQDVEADDVWTGAHFGGGGAEYVEGIMPVTPGTNLSVLVGIGGTGGDTAVLSLPGGTSRVSSGALYAEAAGGEAATLTEGGGPMNDGARQSTLLTIAVPGLSGNGASSGHGGTYIGSRIEDGGTVYGEGGRPSEATAEDGASGYVILEWLK